MNGTFIQEILMMINNRYTFTGIFYDFLHCLLRPVVETLNTALFCSMKVNFSLQICALFF